MATLKEIRQQAVQEYTEELQETVRKRFLKLIKMDQRCSGAWLVDWPWTLDLSIARKATEDAALQVAEDYAEDYVIEIIREQGQLGITFKKSH